VYRSWVYRSRTRSMEWNHAARCCPNFAGTWGTRFDYDGILFRKRTSTEGSAQPLEQRSEFRIEFWRFCFVYVMLNELVPSRFNWEETKMCERGSSG